MLKVQRNILGAKRCKVTIISIKTTEKTSQTPLELKPKSREKLQSKSSGFSIRNPDSFPH